MKKTTKIILSTLLGTALFGAAAIADEAMNTAQVDALIKGNTLYVDIPAGTPGAPDGGIAPIYYSEDGSAAVQLPAGLKLVGYWALKENHYCIDWSNGPKNSCTKLTRSSEGFVLTDANLNEPRGTVTRIVTGNPEKL